MTIALTIWLISVIVTIITFTIILIVLLLKDPGFTYKKAQNGFKSQKINEEKEIIASAQAKATKIIKDAELFKDNVSGQITKTLEEIGQFTEDNTKRISKNISDKASQQLNNVINNHNEKWEQIFTNIEAQTQEQLTLFRKNLADTIEQELATTRQSISKHRIKEEKRITKEIEEQLPSILKKITGQSIPVKVHESLVRTSLAKARQDNILK